MGDRNNRAEVLESLHGLLAVVEAIAEEDCPDLYLTTAAGGGWSIQVCVHGNGDQAARRAQVDRIAALAGLTAPAVVSKTSYRVAGGGCQVYAPHDDKPDEDDQAAGADELDGDGAAPALQEADEAGGGES